MALQKRLDAPVTEFFTLLAQIAQNGHIGGEVVFVGQSSLKILYDL
jgi:hypothetical protein